MVILNEKKYVLNTLSRKETGMTELYPFLSIYARYLCHEDGLPKEEILKNLHDFMQSHYVGYYPSDWDSRLEKYAAEAEKYPLCECNGIWITEKELKTIEDIQNKVLERLAFTLLCLARFADYRNPDNHHWVNQSSGEVCRMACISASAYDKDLKYSLLRKRNLIEYARKISNLNVRVLFTDEKSEKKLFISDFRRLGYEWRLYKGERYIRCTGCGILVKNTNGKRKYCKDCADVSKRALDKARMQALRERRIC